MPTSAAIDERNSTFPDGVGKLPSACGAYSSAEGRFSRAHPVVRSDSTVMPAIAGADQSNASATISSSVRLKHGSSKPRWAASWRNSSVLDTASPSGAKLTAGPIPIPYPNIGKASDTSNGPSKVKTDGQMPMVKGATYMRSSGDEAGTVGGVMSNVNMNVCEFMMYSFDIKLEGKNACRLGDPLFHNKKNIMG